MNGPGEPAPDSSLGRIHHHAGPSARPQARGFHGSPEHPSHGPAAGGLGGCGPACRKGPCCSHDRAAPQLTRCPSFYSSPTPTPGRLPPTLYASLLPRRGPGPAFLGLGAGAGTWPLQVAGPLRWGVGCRTAPHLPPLAPSTHPHSPLLSLTASLGQKRSTSHLGASAFQLRPRYMGECASSL